MDDLPQYLCHKKVRALKIGLVHKVAGQWMLTPTNAHFDEVPVSEDYIKRNVPHAGGYFVVYEDGYQSFSPAEAFEAGYTAIEE